MRSAQKALLKVGADVQVVRRPEELEAAVVLALRQQYGLKADAAVEATARLTGYARTGAKLKAAIEEAIRRLEERGEIKLDSADYVTLK